MANLVSISQSARDTIALAPTASDAGNIALATAQIFGPFPAGSRLIVASSQAFYLRATAGSAVNVTGARFSAGVYKLALPDGCTHLSMLDTADAAGFGQAYVG